MCTALGALNGYIVVKTGLPSFIVTLAFLFILRGFTIFFPQLIERKTIIGGVSDAAEGDWLASIFGGKVGEPVFIWLADLGLIDVFERGNRAGQPVIDGIPALIIWAIGLVIVGHFVLTRTRFGNWIFASGEMPRRPICWRTCQPCKNFNVHVLGVLRVCLCDVPGYGIRIRRS